MQYINVICWIKIAILLWGKKLSLSKTLVFRFSNFEPNQEIRLIKDLKVIWQNVNN
jgi:hypothetical protein